MKLPRMVRTAMVCAAVAGVIVPSVAGADDSTTSPYGEGPIVFAHRGAAGYRPEHTLASYELAIRLGAHVIEPDVVSTRDGVLVVRHENWIGGTTDVAEHPEFADRRTTKVVDGRARVNEWFTEDFTLAELRTLRAVEPRPDIRQRTTLHNGRYQIPTLQEIIDLANRYSRAGRQVGLFPETKHPTYFRSIGLELEPRLIDAIRRNGLDRPDGRVLVQSFEPTSLRILDAALNVPVIQAITISGAPYDTVVAGTGPRFADMVTPAGLAEIASYADGIGPHKDLVIPRRADGSLGQPTPLVADAHAAGLIVISYTFRNENEFLPTNLRSSANPGDYGDAVAEYLAYFAAGVDGVWSDNPDTALLAREEFLNR